MGIPFTPLGYSYGLSGWKLLSRPHLDTKGGVQRQHLDYHHDEFTIRVGRRRSNDRELLFHRLAQQPVAVEPAPYNLITGCALTQS